MTLGEARALLTVAREDVRRAMGDGAVCSVGIGMRELPTRTLSCIVTCEGRDVGRALPRLVCGLPVYAEAPEESSMVAGWLDLGSWGLGSWGRRGGVRVAPGLGLRAEGLKKCGTLGCFVEAMGERFALTCEHVLTDSIHSPRTETRVMGMMGNLDGSGERAVGTIARCAGIRAGQRNQIDAATVRLDPRVRPVLDIAGVGTLRREPVDLDGIWFGMRVKKRGYTSGATVGEISALKDLTIRYKGGEFAQFEEMIEISPLFNGTDARYAQFCSTGDSGAVIVSDEVAPGRSTLRRGEVDAIGLLASHAGVIGRGYAISLPVILEKFGVRLAGR